MRATNEISDGEQLRQTLNTWLQLGLLQESNGKVSLNPGDIPKGDRTKPLIDCQPWHGVGSCFAPENNERFWEVEGIARRGFCAERSVGAWPKMFTISNLVPRGPTRNCAFAKQAPE